MASIWDRLRAAISIGNANSWNNPNAQSRPNPQPQRPQQPVINVGHVINALRQQQAQTQQQMAHNSLIHALNQLVTSPTAPIAGLAKTNIDAPKLIAGLLTHNQQATQNARKALQQDYQPTVDTARQFATRPAAQIGATLAEPLQKGDVSVQTNNPIAKAVLGKNPVQSIPGGVRTNYREHGNLSPAARIALAGAYGAGQVANDLPVAGGALKGVQKGVTAGSKALNETGAALKPLNQAGFAKIGGMDKPNFGKNVEFVPTKELAKYAEHDRTKNPLLSKEQYNALKTDIQQNGIKEPLILKYHAGDKTAYLGEGNHRLAIAQELGIKELPVEVTGTQAKSLAGKGVKVSGSKPDEFGYVPSNQRPSEIGVKVAKPKLGLKPLNEIGAVGKDVNSGNKAVRLKGNTSPQPDLQGQANLGSVPSETQSQAGKAKVLLKQQKASLSGDNGVPTLAQGETGGLNQSSPASIKLSPGYRQRGFIQSVVDDPSTAPSIKQSISSIYKVRNTKELQQRAATFVKENPNAARLIASNVEDDKSLAIASAHWAQEQSRANKLLNSGDSVGANGIFDEVLQQQEQAAKALTKAGQFSQAASVYGKTTPEGVLRFAQNELAKYNKAMNAKIKLSPEDAAKLTQQASDIQKMQDGREKVLAIQQMRKYIQDLMPATWTQKASTLQTMAQLLNPKTLIRNIGGNTIFSGLENVSQAVATPLDKAVGLATGKRTTTLPSLKTQAQAGLKGLKEGSSEAWQGVNTGPDTQFDLNSVPVFKNGALGAGERAMGVALRGPDRAAYEAARADTLRGLMKANKVSEPTPEMVDQAGYVGLYRTFQDNSKAARLFTGIKKALNNIGVEQNGHSFGLGDFILKYPKTPANLLARGIDYSPVGIVKGMLEIARPAVLNQPFDQYSFVNSISRGTVGSSALVGAGAVLSKLGIITAQPDPNTDVRNLQKTEGLGGYQINTSALKRFVLSGFNSDAAKIQPGDQLVSYDWAQPVAIPLSGGAALGKGESIKKGAAKSANSLAEGINTLVEQPLVSGMTTFIDNLKNKGVVGAAESVATGAPASFIPTGVSQINQLTDNTTRNPNDPSIAKQAFNQAAMKIPGLSKTLPASVDVLGQNKERYQNGSNNPFNVLFNPAFVSNYKPNPTADLTMGLNKQTGDTKQLPNTAKSYVVVNGKRMDLNGQQQSDYQRYIGSINNQVAQTLADNPRFTSLPASQQVNILSSLQTDTNSAAKAKLFGDTGKINTSAQSILDGDIGTAMDNKLKTAEKANAPKKIKVKKAKSAKVKKGRSSRGRKSTKVAKTPAIKFSIPKVSSSKPPTIKLKSSKSLKKTKVPVAKANQKKIRISA